MIKFGVCVPNYGETLALESLKSISIEVEKLGFDSLWTTDHIMMQSGSGTPYEQITDSVTTLAYLSGITNKIKLGISSLIIAMRNPLVAAKQLATVDYLSSGRLYGVSIGAGWNEKEFTFLGSNFHDRGKRVNESIRILRDLWAGKAREKFEGTHTKVRYEDAVFNPKPKGPLTIWVGGASAQAMKRAAKLGDAWHPNVTPLESFRKSVQEFRQISPEAKSKPICVRIGLNTKVPQAEYRGPQGDKRIMLSGNMSENKEILQELESLGVTFALLSINPDGKVPLDQQSESVRAIAREFL